MARLSATPSAPVCLLLSGIFSSSASALGEARIAAQEEQITALKAQIYKGVDFK